MTAEALGGPAPDPRAGRQARLLVFLQAAAVAVFVLAVASMVLPGEAGDVIGVAMVAVLVAAPAVRVAWLARRWLAKGDRRFAVAALLLLVVLAVGATIALAGA